MEQTGQHTTLVPGPGVELGLTREECLTAGQSYSHCCVCMSFTPFVFRPMGFPLDRSPPNGDWRALLRGNYGGLRSNMASLPMLIVHKP